MDSSPEDQTALESHEKFREEQSLIRASRPVALICTNVLKLAHQCVNSKDFSHWTTVESLVHHGGPELGRHQRAMDLLNQLSDTVRAASSKIAEGVSADEITVYFQDSLIPSLNSCLGEIRNTAPQSMTGL